MKVQRNGVAKGNIPLSFTQDELDYIVYVLNMKDWRVNKEVDPVGFSVRHKIDMAGKFSFKY